MSKIDKIEQYQAAVDEAIALCDGDVRGALAALLAANEYLETLLSTVGIVPQVGAATLQ
jgi:hypothetical protein